MVSATTLAVFFIPLFFVVVERVFGKGRSADELEAATPAEELS
jgi:hypothetical protein